MAEHREARVGQLDSGSVILLGKIIATFLKELLFSRYTFCPRRPDVRKRVEMITIKTKQQTNKQTNNNKIQPFIKEEFVLTCTPHPRLPSYSPHDMPPSPCHLHFWQNDRDLLHAIVVQVTRGWNRYRNESQRGKLTMENKILPPLLPGTRTRDLSITSPAL